MRLTRREFVIAVGAGFAAAVLDLRVLFTAPKDYANPIERSSVGGLKIARLIRSLVTGHDFAQGRATFYA